MPSSTTKKIIYISNIIFPIKNAGGGSAVLYRHFSRFLAQGIKLLIVNTYASKTIKSDEEFDELQIPKLWYYPPLRKRNGFLLKIRAYLQYHFIKKTIQINQNDVVLGILGEYTNWLSYFIAKKNNLKLNFIFHDEDGLFNRIANNEHLLSKQMLSKILDYTAHIFVVSTQMNDFLMQKGIPKNKIILLYPIPSAQKPSSITGPNNKTFFAGWLSKKMHANIINNIALACKDNGTQLNIVSHFKKEQLAITASNVSVLPFISDEELYFNFTQQFSFCMVFYSFDSELEPRMFTSFPSKLTEYTTLQIPILIIAPPFSTLGIWAQENNWLAYVPTSNADEISKMIGLLNEINFWEKCKAQTILAFKTQFNPENLHYTLKQTLLN
jgi:hypothetical protein